MELAVPIMALGGLYLVSNQKQKREGYSNLETNTHKIAVSNSSIPRNDRAGAAVAASNHARQELEEEPRQYMAANSAMDRYFGEGQHSTYVADWKGKQKPIKEGMTHSLTGEWVDVQNVSHNNMVPYFGARVRQANYKDKNAESILDAKQGMGSQHIKKTEIAPMFKPEANMGLTHGLQSQSTFIQGRINPSMTMNNVKPFESQYVAPALAQQGNLGSGGFNSGMESRELWMPKNVDELRAANKPKESYEGTFLGARAINQERGVMGEFNKNRPETYFENTPDRYLTTTGIEKAPTVRSAQVVKTQHRTHTTTDYYGAQGGDNKATYVRPKMRLGTRPELDAPIEHATNVYMPNAAIREGEYGMAGAKNSVIPNNRTTTEHVRAGGISTFVRAMTAPLMDILRPSRKENMIGNLRGVGMAGTAVPASYTINPADRTKTTIREMTENNTFEMNVGNGERQAPRVYDDAYAVSYGQNRDTKREIVGNAAAAQAPQPYDAVYAIQYGQNRDTKRQVAGPAGSLNPAPASQQAARNSQLIDKTMARRQPMGNNAAVFNGHGFVNVATDKQDADRNNPRMFVPQGAAISQPPAREHYGSTTHRTEYGQDIHTQRNQPEILDAFRSNPFAQPLNSYMS
jgi:hypothetical protein